MHFCIWWSSPAMISKCDWFQSFSLFMSISLQLWVVCIILLLSMLWCRYHHLHHSDKDTNFCLFMPLFDALGNTLNKKSWQSPKLPSSGSGKLSYDLIMTSSNYSFVHFDFNAWWELNITNSISQKLHLHYVFWCKIKFYHITYQLSLQETVTRYPILFSN